MTLTEAMMTNAAAIIFSAGVLWTKVNNVEKKLDEIKDHPERIATLETEVKNIKRELA